MKALKLFCNKIKFLLVFIFIINNAYAEIYTIEDTATVKTINKIELSDGSEYAIISIIGHWKDSVGSFGNSECYGTLEKKNNITLLLDTVCEKKSERGDLITRGGRKKSLGEAGVGRIDIIDARGGFKKLVGNSCKYAVIYFKKHIQYTTKCNIDDNIFNQVLNDLENY